MGELAATLPVSRPAVSQHLRVLKEAGLVSDRAEGTRRIYAVDVAGLARLRADLDAFWTGALGAFKAAVERPQPDDDVTMRTTVEPDHDRDHDHDGEEKS